MEPKATTRLAVRDEAERLSDLCRRSKAHWGYDAQFMGLCREALTVRDEWIDRGWVIVAEVAGKIAGVAAIGTDESDFEIALFFVEPTLMGKGVGGVLYRALMMRAREERIGTLKVLSDPNAAVFYRKMGARMVGNEPSDAIPGRTLPLLEIDVPN